MRLCVLAFIRFVYSVWDLIIYLKKSKKNSTVDTTTHCQEKNVVPSYFFFASGILSSPPTTFRLGRGGGRFRIHHVLLVRRLDSIHFRVRDQSRVVVIVVAPAAVVVLGLVATATSRIRQQSTVLLAHANMRRQHFDQRCGRHSSGRQRRRRCVVRRNFHRRVSSSCSTVVG